MQHDAELTDDLKRRTASAPAQPLYFMLAAAIPQETELNDVAAVLVCLLGSLLTGLPNDERLIMGASILALSLDLSEFVSTNPKTSPH